MTFDEKNVEIIPKPEWYPLKMLKGVKDKCKLLFSVSIADYEHTFTTPIKNLQLDANDIEDDESDWGESDEEGDGMDVKTTIKGRVDGLEKFVDCLPFAQTEFDLFIETVDGLLKSQDDLTLQLLKEAQPKESQWSEKAFPDIDADKFIEACFTKSKSS